MELNKRINEEMTKYQIVSSLTFKKGKKNVKEKGEMQ